jgi:cleavage and polyadenylation specificity factor subunit 1
MDGILREVPFVFVYLDDILVASTSETERLDHLRTVFNLLSKNGMVINKSKCLFGVSELDYLGHHVTTNGIQPMMDRVSAINEFPVPTDKTSLQRFLGMINYYHRFIPRIAELLDPLHGAASVKGTSITWSEYCQNSFKEVKSALATSTLLHHPRPNSPTSITVDASNVAIGGQLEQLQAGQWVPIAFFSKKLSVAEKKYSAFDQELLASFRTIKHFSHYVEGRSFTLYTDHKPLTFALASLADRSPRQTRHLSFISQYTTDIRHISGKQNVVADALSRIDSVSFPSFDYARLALSQASSEEIADYRTSITNLKFSMLNIQGNSILCDISTGKPRPVVPCELKKRSF